MQLRYKSFRGFLDHFSVDIACFQEIKLPAAKMTRELACVPGFQSFWATSTGKSGYSGVTTWCRAPDAAPRDAAADCLGCDEQPELDTEGRLVVTDHGAFVLLNAYVPNAGDRPERARLGYKLAFLRALRRKMEELTAEGRQVIAVGDFNVAAEPRDVHAAIKYDTLYDDAELAELRGLAAAYPDVWRRLHPDAEGAYTVWEERTSARAFNVGLRIDYAFVSPGLLQFVESCEILSVADIPPKWSDHAALLLKLRVHRAPGSLRAAPGALPGAPRPGTEEREQARRAEGQQQEQQRAEAHEAEREQEDAPRAEGQRVEAQTSAGEQQGQEREREREGHAAQRPSCPGPDAGGGDGADTAVPPAPAAALPRLELPPPPAAPCAMWQATEARFVDRSQRSIRDLFGCRSAPNTESAADGRPAAAPATAADEARAAVAAAGRGGAAAEGGDARAPASGSGRKRGAEGQGGLRLAPALRPGTGAREGKVGGSASEGGGGGGAPGAGPGGAEEPMASNSGEGAAREAAAGGSLGEERPQVRQAIGEGLDLSRGTDAEAGSMGPGSSVPAGAAAGAGAGAAGGGRGGRGGGGGGGVGARGAAGRGASGAKAPGRKGQGGGSAHSGAAAGKQRNIQSFFKGKA